MFWLFLLTNIGYIFAELSSLLQVSKDFATSVPLNVFYYWQYIIIYSLWQHTLLAKRHITKILSFYFFKFADGEFFYQNFVQFFAGTLSNMRFVDYMTLTVGDVHKVVGRRRNYFIKISIICLCMTIKAFVSFLQMLKSVLRKSVDFFCLFV